MSVILCPPTHSKIEESLLIVSQILSTFVPELVMFFVAIPRGDIRHFFYWQYQRTTIFTCTLFIYLSVYGGRIWNLSIGRTGIMLVVISGVLQNYKFFASPYVCLVLNTTSILLYIIAVLCLIWLFYLWFLGLRDHVRSQKLTDEQYSVGVYIILFVLISISLLCSVFILGNKPYEELQSSYFMYLSYCFSIYFGFVFIFQKQFSRYNIKNAKDELQFKRMFVNHLSHEIRTPLNAVNSGLELLEEDLREHPSLNNATSLDTIGDSKNSCEAALCVVNELLQFDKLEGGTLELEKSEFDVWSVVVETVASFRTQARRVRVTMVIPQKTFLEEEEKAEDQRGKHLQNRIIMVSADKNKFVQVLRNLISNGLKFTPPHGKVTVAVKVRMSASNATNSICALILEVTDTGAGLTQMQQGKLFKSIIQFTPGRLQGGGGSGLGLYLSQGMIKMHGGNLSVTSPGIGHGSTFTLTMPCSVVTLDPNIPQADARHSLSINSVNNNVGQLEIISPSVLAVPTNKRRSSVLPPDILQLINEQPCAISISPSTGSGKSSVPSGPDLRVLVVDDIDLSRKMTIKRLERENCTWDQAVDGLDAVEKMRLAIAAGVKYDLVLTDYSMPNMDGPEAIRHMRALGYLGKIVGITGHEDAFHINMFMSNGANKVLVKPVDKKTLVAQLDLNRDAEWGIDYH